MYPLSEAKVTALTPQQLAPGDDVSVTLNLDPVLNDTDRVVRLVGIEWRLLVEDA